MKNIFRGLVFWLVLFGAAAVHAVTTLTQYDCTIVMSGTVATGQFANGDYWMVGPVTIEEIKSKNDDGTVRASVSGINTPDSTGITINGATINPIADAYPAHGFDSRLIGYDESLNVARKSGAPLSSSNTRTVAAGSSICVVSSRILVGTGGHALLNDFAVFTVLASAPAAGSFRPPYIGTDKTIYWNKSSIDYSILKNKTPLSGQTAPTASAFTRPWMHVSTEYNNARDFAPYNNQPEYDRDMGYYISEALLDIHQDYAVYGASAAAVKETAVVRVIQKGIDAYGAARYGFYSVSGTPYGAQMNNFCHKGPVVIAGLALADSNILYYVNDANKVYAPYFYQNSHMFSRWGEDQVIKYVASAGANTGAAEYNMVVNDQYQNAGPESGRPRYTYPLNYVSLPEWDYGSNWGNIYRNVRYPGMLGSVISILLTTGGKAAWNNDAFFDYFVRAFGIYTAVPGTDPTITLHKNAYNNWLSGVTLWTKPAPLVGTASIRDYGSGFNRFVVQFSDNVSGGSSSAASFTLHLSGGAVTLTYVSGSGTTEWEFSASRTIGASEINGTFDCTGANMTATTGGAAVQAMTGNPVINYAYNPPAGETGGGGGRALGGDVTAPSITITAPTSGTTYSTSATPLTTLAGVASDDAAVSSVTWSNAATSGSGTATGTTSWSVASIALNSGSNVITVTATDTSSNTSTDVLTVTYTPNTAGGTKRGGKLTIGGKVSGN